MFANQIVERTYVHNKEYGPKAATCLGVTHGSNYLVQKKHLRQKLFVVDHPGIRFEPAVLCSIL